MLVKNGCFKCKHPYDGLSVPIYRGSLDKSAKVMPPEQIATMDLEWSCCVGPGCYNPMAATLTRTGDNAVIGKFDSKGMSCCPSMPLSGSTPGRAAPL